MTQTPINPSLLAGKVILVGAGPGDPDLMTVYAQRYLQQADVVLHDALIHSDILNLCGPEAVVVNVGKRAGRKSERQSNINARLVKEALAGHLVVRLKGGDPYLFGRGSEEVEYLHKQGIAFEVIPGVPSPIAATAFAGISLTHRELASSVAYVTATESAEKDATAHDWNKLATSTQTLVIFMGLRKLRSLMTLLQTHGRSAATPVAIISQASLPEQQTVVGQLDNIAGLIEKSTIKTPALIVVGEVASLRPQLRWYDRQPLFGKRVLVTRPEHQSGKLCDLLRIAGARTVPRPAIQIEGVQSPQIDECITAEKRPRWIVFTSANGVKFFFAALNKLKTDARWFSNVRVCAVGPATAKALTKHGLSPDLVPSRYQAEYVADSLIQQDPELQDGDILLPRAQDARAVLPNRLTAVGAQVTDLPVYKTTAHKDLREIAVALSDENIDIITFTSSSTVLRTLEALGPNTKLLNNTVTACIGPITAETLQNAGFAPDIVATEYTAEGLVTALEKHYNNLRSP